MLKKHLFSILQKDIFQLIGAPLVENCLAGFNSSVFAYGQVYPFRLCFFHTLRIILCDVVSNFLLKIYNVC